MGSTAAPLPPLPPVQLALFAVLFRAHQPAVLRMARSAGVHAADEADVIQEVFLALHRAIGRGLDVSTPLGGWFKRATFRRAKDLRKLARCGREVLTPKGEIDAEDGGPSPEATMVAIDARRLLLELLDELRNDLRMVLVMSDIEEMPMSEIATILEISEGTGYSRLRAARRDFEAVWKRRREEQTPRAAARAIAPFLLFDAQSLLDIAERPIPDDAPDLQDRAWSRLVDALGPALQGPAALAVVGGAAAAAAGAAAKGAAMAKGAAVLLTAKQIAIGVVLSMVVGAVLHAALRPANAAPDGVAITRDATHAAAVPSESMNAMGAAVASATAAPMSQQADAGAVVDVQQADAGAVVDVQQAERNVIARARAALARAVLAQDNKTRARELSAGLAALDEHEKRFQSPLLAESREALRRQAMLFEQAHMNHDGGQP